MPDPLLKGISDADRRLSFPSHPIEVRCSDVCGKAGCSCGTELDKRIAVVSGGIVAED